MLAFTLLDSKPWKMLRLSAEMATVNSLWCVMLLQSGRFAISIFDSSVPILHKVFRHYTIRAKSGGSQSSHDNKGNLLLKIDYIMLINESFSC